MENRTIWNMGGLRNLSNSSTLHKPRSQLTDDFYDNAGRQSISSVIRMVLL